MGNTECTTIGDNIILKPFASLRCRDWHGDNWWTSVYLKIQILSYHAYIVHCHNIYGIISFLWTYYRWLYVSVGAKNLQNHCAWFGRQWYKSRWFWYRWFFNYSRPIVILNSHELIKDAFVTQGDAFSTRPDSAWLTVMKITDGKTCTVNFDIKSGQIYFLVRPDY